MTNLTAVIEFTVLAGIGLEKATVAAEVAFERFINLNRIYLL